MLREIDLVADIIEGVDFSAYGRDKKLRRAVERCVEIVSEASRRLPLELQDEHSDQPWPEIAAIGNLLRHEYQRVDDLIMWDRLTITAGAPACHSGHAQEGRAVNRYALAVHWSSEDGVWITEAPDLKPCASHGDTPEEAVSALRAATAPWLGVARVEGWPIPAPRFRALPWPRQWSRGASGGAIRPRAAGEGQGMPAPHRARLGLAATLLVMPSAAPAWHDTVEGGFHSSGGGVPLDAIVPIVVAVVIGGVALAVWGRKPRGKPHRRRRGRR